MRCKAFLSQLHLWLDGRLPAGGEPALEAHAAACPSCAAELARERRLIEMLDGGLVDPPLPVRLRDRIHGAVDALALLEGRPVASAHASASPPLVGHPIAIQWISMAAVLLITLTAGLAMGHRLAPAPGAATAVMDAGRGASGDAPPAVAPSPPVPGTSVPTLRASDGVDGRQVVPVGEPVAEQLARHLDTTEGLYHQVLHVERANERMTRALVRSELALSQIKSATPALRIAIVGDPRLAEPARVYFDQAEGLLARIEEWVDSPKVELDLVRGQVERVPLPQQIAQLRLALGPAPGQAPLPEEVTKLLSADELKELSKVPGVGNFLQFRLDFHQGRMHEARVRLQQFGVELERNPRNPLAEEGRFWLARVQPDGEATCEVEFVAEDGRREVMIQPFAVAQFEALKSNPEALVINGRRVALVTPAGSSSEPAAKAFAVVWKAAEARQIELGRAGKAGGLVVTDAETRQTTSGAGTATPPATIVLRQVALEIPDALWAKELEAAYAALCQRANVPPQMRSERPRILQITVPMSILPRDR